MKLPWIQFRALAATVAASVAASAFAAEPDQPWSQQMADAILAREPHAVMLENPGNAAPKWSYSTAFCVRAVMEVGLSQGEKGGSYIQYARDYMDAFIDEQGTIGRAYDPRGHRLDDIAPGQLILMLQADTSVEKYQRASLQLAQQFKSQPRIAGEGGFWHKDIYPNQMWLDGIFMDCPFMARLGAMNQRPTWFDEVTNQILVLAKHAQDPKTGLCCHGWDASRKERWANPQTGLSPCFWGRAMGWFMCGIVESLDYLPTDHPKRTAIIDVLRRCAAGVAEAQDRESGLWWQVLDQGGRAGNYRESSASCMFVYALARGSREGYIETKYRDVAQRGYAGVLAKLIERDAQGRLNLKDTCQVAGLGGNPYRDGTYEYYVREPRVSNDPKGMAPFILSSLEMELLKH